MEFGLASSAIGIGSVGIQVCQALLTYYEDWKDYHADISNTYTSIHDLSRTLILLYESLNDDALDEERKNRVKTSLRWSENSLAKLSEICQKLRQYGQPEGIRRKVWAELQRAWFPFKASTLTKLQANVSDAREHLKLAVQVLQLDIAITTSNKVGSVAIDTGIIIGQNVALATSVTQVSVKAQQILALQQSDQFRQTLNWLNAPDPTINHAAARQKREALTGTWLLHSSHYRRWKARDFQHMWLYGSAGCGKTVLCSTVIEDIRAYCEGDVNAMHAMFYFTFSDDSKQSYENLLRSLVAQLGWEEPGMSMLKQAYERSSPHTPTVDDLEKIFLASIGSYDEQFILLDALDECPAFKSDDEVRQIMLEALERLTQVAPNIRLFVTSRKLSDIGESMGEIQAMQVSIATYPVDVDIAKYISTQLTHDRRLRKLSTELKNLIRDTISQRAGGMFRWAYCQLQAIKKLDSQRPSDIKAALKDLPETLDETYERMLTGIQIRSRKDALTLLRWLAYARSPLSLGQLAEARIIDLEGDGAVLVDDRGGIEDPLHILSGLVTADRAGDDPSETPLPTTSDIDPNVEDSEMWDDTSARTSYTVGKNTKIRLAHFSVKEYLESEWLKRSKAQYFYLDNIEGQYILAQSCLVYLEFYSDSDLKASCKDDLEAFPLLEYSAATWYHHSRDCHSEDVTRETSLLQFEYRKQNWLQVHKPDDFDTVPFGGLRYRDIESGLYYASFMGLLNVVTALLEHESYGELRSGALESSLRAASGKGYQSIVKLLLARGVNVNATPGDHHKHRYLRFQDDALQAAIIGGHVGIVKILIEHGADVNARAGSGATALCTASRFGYNEIVKVLIDQGADIDVRDDGVLYARIIALRGSALNTAISRGHESTAKILLDRGADTRIQLGGRLDFLKTAAHSGCNEVIKILLNRGARVDCASSKGPSALYEAAAAGQSRSVSILLDHGADMNCKGRDGTVLQAAIHRGQKEVVEILIERGADTSVLSDQQMESVHGWGLLASR